MQLETDKVDAPRDTEGNSDKAFDQVVERLIIANQRARQSLEDSLIF